MDRLNVRCLVQTPQGWISLNDGEICRLTSNSFDRTVIAMRREEVTAPYVEGKFVTNSVRDNVIENLEVRVSATDNHDISFYIDALIAAFQQLYYSMYVEIDGRCEMWDCSSSDVNVSNQHVFRHARLAVVNVEISRQPRAVQVDDATAILPGLWSSVA